MWQTIHLLVKHFKHIATTNLMNWWQYWENWIVAFETFSYFFFFAGAAIIVVRDENGDERKEGRRIEKKIGLSNNLQGKMWSTVLPPDGVSMKMNLLNFHINWKGLRNTRSPEKVHCNQLINLSSVNPFNETMPIFYSLHRKHADTLRLNDWRKVCHCSFVFYSYGVHSYGSIIQLSVYSWKSNCDRRFVFVLSQ